jgi:hypothetical protein
MIKITKKGVIFEVTQKAFEVIYKNHGFTLLELDEKVKEKGSKRNKKKVGEAL